MADDITYIKVTQLASSDSATTVGAIFPDSQYLDIYGTDSGQVTELSDSNEKIPTSKMVQQELNKKVGKVGNNIITASTSDTPLFLRSTNNNSTWIGFQANNGNELGYLGVSNNNLPYFYYNSAHQLAYNNDIHNSTITIKQSGISDQTFTLNQSTNTTINLSDNNTTYTLATGDNNGQIKVTPSSGNAYNVSVKGLGSRAYDSTEYLPLSGGNISGNLVTSGNLGSNGGALIYNSNNTPLRIQGNTTQSTYLKLLNVSGTTLGLFGANSSHNPIFNNGTNDSILAREDNLKTINNQSIVGTGNLSIAGDVYVHYIQLTLSNGEIFLTIVNNSSQDLSYSYSSGTYPNNFWNALIAIYGDSTVMHGYFPISGYGTFNYDGNDYYGWAYKLEFGKIGNGSSFNPYRGNFRIRFNYFNGTALSPGFNHGYQDFTQFNGITDTVIHL